MVEFTSENIWSWTFLVGRFLLLIQKFHLLVCLGFLFLHDSVLVSCMFLGIYPFLLGYPICVLWYFLFLCIHCNDSSLISDFLFFSFKDFIYSFLEGGEVREKERERNINVWLPLKCPPTGDLARNPGMCPDWQSNQWPFGSQAGTQSTEPHQPGLILFLCVVSFFLV